ncbi:hypothetical protein EST38_g9316 [Candolleomyces aberdarensis]|uniref:Uncharacterized protein n=1 Tax=Candolleomyces aberdarensis TaxID=2316362 RepID=A0A4Q2DDF6_9AGAR|nr:hypothetical protein EST38_g9316 [Candolleomyces aberdarensis]
MGRDPVKSVFSGRVLALTIYPALSLLSAYLILGHLFEFYSPLRSEYCSPSTKNGSTYALPYTGFQRLDYELCFMVSVFHAAINDSIGYTFLKYFLGTSSIYIVLPCLEALRPPNAAGDEGRLGRSLRWPASWLQATQVVTLGVTMPVWGLVVSLVRMQDSTAYLEAKEDQKRRTGADNQENRPAIPTAHDVLSIIPSVVFGGALPSYAFFHYQDPKITVLWQIFPIYVFLAGWIYRRLANLAHSHSTTSVKDASRFILIASFLTSAYFHLIIVWPLFVSGDVTSLQQLFLPAYSPTPATVESSVVAFLRYDFHFAWISALLVTFLTVRFQSVWHAAQIVVVTSVGMVLVGPGAMVAGAALWKEGGTLL